MFKAVKTLVRIAFGNVFCHGSLCTFSCRNMYFDKTKNTVIPPSLMVLYYLYLLTYTLFLFNLVFFFNFLFPLPKCFFVAEEHLKWWRMILMVLGYLNNVAQKWEGWRLRNEKFKIENSLQGRKLTVMVMAKNGSLTKIGVVWQKSYFWTKNRNFGPKKESHFLTLTMFWPRPEKVVQRKKVPLPK